MYLGAKTDLITSSFFGLNSFLGLLEVIKELWKLQKKESTGIVFAFNFLNQFNLYYLYVEKLVRKSNFYKKDVFPYTIHIKNDQNENNT